MIISLKDFALTGQFGPVKVGMSKKEVISLLGTPDNDEDLGSGFSEIAYSWYEFFFDDHSDKLYGIQNDALEDGHKDSIFFKNKHFEIDTWIIEVGKLLTYRDVKAQLKAEGISFDEKEKYDRPHFYFESGAYLDFGKDEGGSTLEGNKWIKIPPKEYDSVEDWPLIGIRYFPSEW